MKKLYTFLAAILLTATTFAQAPEQMSYQAVVRDSDNALVTNQAVGMQISILQGSATGTAVYEETQTPTTNANGLVTLEIGTGTTLDDFTSIDWSNGTYFIKTETDPTGGTSYSITGVSQLLSVPFALHAKTAQSVIETQTLSDVVDLGNTVNNQLKAITDPTEAQDAATKAYVDTLIAALEARIAALEPAKVGDFREGGVVFYIFESGDTGYVEGETHGLVCAIEDQSSGIQWYNGSNTTTGATGIAVGTGQANTTAIIAIQGDTETNYAAGLAKAYNGGGYSDWFLPSKDELNLMYTNKATINTTATANEGSSFSRFYWSSTEFDDISAWEQSFYTGYQGYYNKDNASNSVRAVRAF